MDRTKRNLLLKIAKKVIIAAVNKEDINPQSSDDPELNEKHGVFVTIKNGINLRGCMGNFEAQVPLIQMVSDMAVDAAIKDPRFIVDPIAPDELDNLEVEISILSELKKTEDPLELRLGIDGLYIKHGHKSGCYLPRVATDSGWTEEQFLTCCCIQKARLDGDAWRDPETEIYFFTAESFGEAFENL